MRSFYSPSQLEKMRSHQDNFKSGYCTENYLSLFFYQSESSMGLDFFYTNWIRFKTTLSIRVISHKH